VRASNAASGIDHSATFGRLQYLRPTVASVYRQTLQDWELIVADDGSDAETRAYLRTLQTDSRVTLLWLTQQKDIHRI